MQGQRRGAAVGDRRVGGGWVGGWARGTRVAAAAAAATVSAAQESGCQLLARRIRRTPRARCPPGYALRSYKWDTLPNAQRPEKGLLRLRASLNAFANLRPAVVLPQLADASTLKREVRVQRGPAARPLEPALLLLVALVLLLGAASLRCCKLTCAPRRPACSHCSGGGGGGHPHRARAGGRHLLWPAEGGWVGACVRAPKHVGASGTTPSPPCARLEPVRVLAQSCC